MMHMKTTATKKPKKIVHMKDQIIPKYWKVFNDREHLHKIITSGRAGTKSSEMALEAVFTIISPEPASVVILRKRHNKLRKTVYKEVLRAIGRLGLKKSAFKIRVSPMEITYKATGNTIFFTGSDNVDDTKGIIDEERPIKKVVLDEVSEFFEQGEGEDEIQNIEATFIRGNHGGFQMLYLYNPPKNPNAPVVQWTRKMEQRPDCIHVHSDYRDVPPEWLGDDLIRSAEIMKETDARQYRWVWLGLSVGVDDVIYYMFGNGRIQRPDKKHYRVCVIGVDYGQQNATAYEAWGIDDEKHRMTGLAEYYHSGRDTGRQKSPSEYAKDFENFLDGLYTDFGCGYFYAFIDPSARGLAEEVKRTCKGDKPYELLLRDANNDVALGIGRVQKLLTYQMMSMSPMQSMLIEEIGVYEYDKKSIEHGKEVPVKEFDHGCDAMRYAVMGAWKRMKPYLPVKEYEKEYVAPIYR